MKLENNNIKLETTKTGEINSIKYKDQEILHDGKQWWSKTYPMIWPNISNSNGFKVEDKNYKLPRHGFWKELKWESMIENGGITMVATHMANDIYPFTIDIQHQIMIDKNSIIITTVFSNLSKERAYFHFGHHPAFLIDENTLIKQEGTLTGTKVDGKRTLENFTMKPVSLMEFEPYLDTYTFRNVDSINASFEANNLKINIESEDFTNLWIWKPSAAKFVCIEPMQGQSDQEVDDYLEAWQKENIVSLDSGDARAFELKIKISKAK